jgi:hypothetical protein
VTLTRLSGKEHRVTARIGAVAGVHAASKYDEMSTAAGHVGVPNATPTRVSGLASGGGLLMFQRSFHDDFPADDSPMPWVPQEPPQRLARDGKLAMHPPEYFWQAMDTKTQDHRRLNRVSASGAAPWRVWR